MFYYQEPGLALVLPNVEHAENNNPGTIQNQDEFSSLTF
jgi:hypothetical protein